ncbi:MAG TPA: NUDIX domain-containing protein [Galbitalea sp.]|jgi:8-oxo-dGTP pyrophosphatase MutT (NUDIX family)
MTVGHRLTSRVLLFDEGGSILLFLTTAPDTSLFARWVTPGGGVDPGETHRDAAIRELFEETGLRISDPGEPVWNYDFVVEWDNADHDTGHAEYYVVRTTRFDPSSEGWTDDEKIDTLDSRWWSLDDLRTTGEPFEPANLLDLVSRYRTTTES